MRDIKIKYGYSDGINMFEKAFTLDEIEQGLQFDETSDSPLLKNYKIVHKRQYTGYKIFKNGVEIYEGDIVIEKSYPFFGNAPEITDSNQKCDELNYVGVVVWDDGYYIDLKVVSNRSRGSAIGNSLYDYTELEVIGNIYENPELLN